MNFAMSDKKAAGEVSDRTICDKRDRAILQAEFQPSTN
jgi:hypothetical protein